MKCIIPGSNVKVFGRSIHSLSKIGEELYIEPLEHGLALRTVNSSRSAYACFIFAPTFFTHYDDGGGMENPDDVFRCKIGVKSLIAVFKSLSTLEKTVEKCKIKYDAKESRMIFQLYCKHGIVKTYNLSYIECETLQAVFSKDLCPNILCAQTRLLCDIVMNFQVSQEEVTLIVDPANAKFKNYVEDEPDPIKAVHTEMTLDPEEFDSYQIGVDQAVTFCLKELRAILAFSEPMNLPLSIHFESPGRPIVFAIDSESSFEANFVLATLADKNISPKPGGNKQAKQIVPSKLNQSHHHFNRKNSTNNTQPSTSNSRARNESYICNDTLQHEDSTLIQHNDKNQNQVSIAENFRAAEDDNELEAAMLSMDTTKLEAQETVDNRSVGDVSHTSIKSSHPIQTMKTAKSDREPEENGGSPVIPYLSHQKKEGNVELNRSSILPDSSDDDEDDTVPGTPPPKRFRSVFMGLSQSTTASIQQSQTKRVILAEDTDDED